MCERDTRPKPGARLLDHECDVAELGHIATALRFMTASADSLDGEGTASVYFLACLATELIRRLSTAMDRDSANG